jgi:signal transduction histidine kinase
MAGNLLRDLLDFGQMEENKFSLNREISDVMAIVNKAGDVLHKQLEMKDLKIETSICEEDRPILKRAFVDEHRLCQVLINLISNAAKFSPRGSDIGVQVSVICREPVFADHDDYDDLKLSLMSS